MVNGFRYYRALESVSIASALSTALTIYPCQNRVHQRCQSKLQLPTARKKEWRPATAGSSPHAITCQHCDTHYFSRPRTRNLPIVGWLLVRRASRYQQCHRLTRYAYQIFIYFFIHLLKNQIAKIYCRYKNIKNVSSTISHFYRAMHFSAKRGIAIACRLSVCLSVCDVGDHVKILRK